MGKVKGGRTKKNINNLSVVETISSGAPVKPTDAEVAGFKGKVKQVKQICYKASRKNSTIVKGKIENSDYSTERNFSTSYNENGMKTEDQAYNTGGWYTRKSYNSQGLPVEETHYYLEGKLMHNAIYRYNEQGLRLEHSQTDNLGNSSHKTLSEYDDYGNMIDIVSYDSTGKISYRSTSKYDDKKQVIETISQDAKGLISKVFRQYDDKGNAIEVSQYTDEVLTYQATTKYKYDNQGNKLEWTTNNYHQAGTLSAKSVFKCNLQGDIIEAHHYNKDGSLSESRTFSPEYDEKGNKIVPSDEEEEDLKSETEECENDAHGNWVKKTTYYSPSEIAWKKIPVNLYIREISYWGEDSVSQNSLESFYADIKTTHDEKAGKEESTINPLEELTPKQLKWLSETNSANDPFPIFRYYSLTNKEMPSLLNYSGPYIEVLALLDELKENLDAKMIYSLNSVWNQQEEILSRYILSFPGHPGFLLNVSQISGQNADEFEIPAFMYQGESYESSSVYFSSLQLLRPSNASGKLEEYGDEDDFARELEDYINKCSLRKKPDKPVINLIEVNNNAFLMVEHAVDDDFEIRDLDVNYGYGFANFHDELMQRFNTSTKGLVLFHGQPGTGKTYYIRHLLRKMTSGKKIVIYMPPNMVDHLVEPSFMTFLAGEVKSWSNEGNFCVLLIEDAEPLLAKRQEGVRIQGVTNLLNMTDGLLNDMLNLQIICTFNVDLKKLDSALLRPGRLIARKEFKALSELDANLLAQRLGIKHHFTAPATLGEIYALGKNKNTLIHDVEHNENASTLLDDL